MSGFVWVYNPDRLEPYVNALIESFIPKEDKPPSKIKELAINILFPDALEAKKELLKKGGFAKIGRLWGVLSAGSLAKGFFQDFSAARAELIGKIKDPLKYNTSVIIGNSASIFALVAGFYSFCRITSFMFLEYPTTDLMSSVSSVTQVIFSTSLCAVFSYTKFEISTYCDSLYTKLPSDSSLYSLPKESSGLFLEKIRAKLNAKQD